MQTFDIHQSMTKLLTTNLVEEEYFDRVEIIEMFGQAKLEADIDLFSKLLGFVIRNALRHCGADQIKVTVTNLEKPYVQIDDNGIGLHLNELQKIYESKGCPRGLIAQTIKPWCEEMGIRLEHSTAEQLGFNTVLWF